MKRIVTTAVVLNRINFGEADRIITALTPDNGKLRLMARGVRKVKSKLAGGVELFSISSITFMPGKKDISTLMSSRLNTHFGAIAQDINRTMAAYDILKTMNNATEDDCEPGFYHLLVKALTHLNEQGVDTHVVLAWFNLNLLQLLGHQPNLNTTNDGTKLSERGSFNFDYEHMCFFEHPAGQFRANDIKLLRLLSKEEPGKMMHIKNIATAIKKVDPVVNQSLKQFVQ